jgi:hypothetical protein
MAQEFMILNHATTLTTSSLSNIQILSSRLGQVKMHIKTQPSNTLLQVLGSQNLPLLNNLLLLFVKGLCKITWYEEVINYAWKRKPHI